MPAWAAWLLMLITAALFAAAALFTYQDHPNSAGWVVEILSAQVWAVGAILVGRTGG